jgi:DNA polymerase
MKKVEGGFFNIFEEEVKETGMRRTRGKKLPGCDACGLSITCKSPKMALNGDGKKGILIIGEAPGASEDEQGRPFCGRSGQRLEKALTAAGIRMREDCWITNAVLCRPPENRTPTPFELDSCQKNLRKVLDEKKPKTILVLGTTAVDALLDPVLTGRLTGIRPSDLFGTTIPSKDFSAWVCPTYHPSFIIRNEKDAVLQKIFDVHVSQCVKKAEEMLLGIVPKVLTTEDPEQAIVWIKEAQKSQVVAFDYETTGIKPHADGHRIVCVSVAFDGRAYAFPFFSDVPPFVKEWRVLMRSNRVGKIAHKIDFEWSWTRYRSGTDVDVRNWVWDTCLSSHCLKNHGKTGLKFQVFSKFGVAGYDADIDEYLKSDKDAEGNTGCNAKNRIDGAPVDQLLEYCAMDSFYSWELYRVQDKQMIPHIRRGFNFLLEGVTVLARAQSRGMRVSITKMTEYAKQLTAEIAAVEKRLQESEERKKWPSSTLNFNSPDQLSKLLYTILGYPKPAESPTDEDALEKIGTKFTQDIVAMRKKKRIRDTYLGQYQREVVPNPDDPGIGIIHPFFNLHIADTFRSSSDSPNFQNIPKRDLEAKKIVRSCILPSPGNRIIEYDFKGAEVCAAASITKDPALIRYVSDPTTDMHRDVALQMFFRDRETFTKAERQAVKNGFVFPEFYGSNAEACAPNIWEMISIETKMHLRKNNIRNCMEFEDHVREIETDFWGKRFRAYKRWKYEFYKEYERRGYLDLVTGFRCYGPLKFTQVTNYPIQGPAFHVLLWAMIQISDPIEEISGRSAIMGQVHDSLIVDGHPDDEAEIDRLVTEYATRRVRKHWDWISVPLTIEKERSEIDGNWSEMHETVQKS